MFFFLIFGIGMLLPGAFFAVLAIMSTDSRNLVSTTGELTRYRGYKNYKLKNRTVPNATEYAYTYTANNKHYQLRGVQLKHSRNLRKRVVIVYLRAFPRCAYEGHFSGIAEWLIAASSIALGVLCIVIYFLVI